MNMIKHKFYAEKHQESAKKVHVKNVKKYSLFYSEPTRLISDIISSKHIERTLS